MAVEALYRTSMALALARTVLASQKRGGGVPDNKRGVWTSRDDEKLTSVDAIMNQPTENIGEHKKKERMKSIFGALVKKHGEENVVVRRRFLVDAKAAGLNFS